MFPHSTTVSCRTLIASFVATLLTASFAHAEAQKWDYTGFLYLWGPAMSGETATGQDFDLSFSDVVDKLDFALMGSLEARNGPIAIFGDALYLNLSEGRNAAVGPGIPATADANVKGLALTVGAGRDFSHTNRLNLNGFVGLRHTILDTTANVGIGGGSQRANDTLRNWDVIVGLRGTTEITDRWAITYYGDIGAGQSDLTWQANLSFD
ncbi:hypothetical protein SAMN04488036_1142 [Shimia haliotis]|uniref:Outer membrane protein beta-barrel domain-containing protein n=2 Tax=Shimia haliotis TaxID=1280847 RepID=A0A1I4HJ53_9RHOB|nr:hypothetical protein SAMN04488036_1142 [Shimia haliotis]